MASSIQSSHLVRAASLLERLDEPTHHVNDQPVAPLTDAGADVIATAAMAHAVLALAEQVHRDIGLLHETLEQVSRAVADLSDSARGQSGTVWGSPPTRELP